MPTYQVVLKTAAFYYKDIEAADQDEAYEKAFEDTPDICAQCSGWNRDYSLELNEEWEPESAEEATP